MYFLVLPQQSSLGPVLLHLLGITKKYSPSVQTNMENQLFQYCPTRKVNTGSITFRNWKCLYYDLSQDIRWKIAWALGKSFWLLPWDFPCAAALFHYCCSCCRIREHPHPTLSHLKSFIESAVPPIRLFLMIIMMPLKRCVAKENYLIALLRN